MQIFIDDEDNYSMEKLNTIREKWVNYIQTNDEDSD